MSPSTPPRTPVQAAASSVDASALSRRELQYLARELELCRGNAKSDVIMDHVVAFMASSDGATRVAMLLGALPEEYKLRTPGAKSATPARTTRETTRPDVTPRAIEFEEDATPSRRSSRASSRTSVTDVSEAAAATTAPSNLTSPVERKMDFAADDQEETTTKHSKAAHAKETSHLSKTGAKSPTTKTSTSATGKTLNVKANTPEKRQVVGTTATAPPQVEERTSAKKEKPSVKKEKPSTKKEKTPEKSAPVADALPTTRKSPVKGVSTSDAATTPTRRTTTPKNGRSPLANVSNMPAERAPSAVTQTVESLLESVGDLVAVSSDRVKCTTTGHEMKAEYDVISAYISGKRYQRAHHQKLSFSKFAPMFVTHPDEKQSHLLWCSVTQTSIARNVERIEAHMKGPRYVKELPAWQTEQEALAVAKEAEQKQQDAAQKQTKKAPHKHPKRKASGAIPAEGRRVKVPRNEAK